MKKMTLGDKLWWAFLCAQPVLLIIVWICRLVFGDCE